MPKEPPQSPFTWRAVPYHPEAIRIRQVNEEMYSHMKLGWTANESLADTLHTEINPMAEPVPGALGKAGRVRETTAGAAPSRKSTGDVGGIGHFDTMSPPSSYSQV